MRGSYRDTQSKTYAIVYDTSNIMEPELIRLSGIEGNMTQSRMIGDTLYLLTNNHFNIPYYDFKSVDDINVDSRELLPQQLDLTKNTERS